MKSLRKKLILSILMVVCTIITLTSTTYAWFSSNKVAWTDEFFLTIEQTDGLYISIDDNFSTNVTSANLKKAIVAKMNGLSTIDDKEILTDEYVETEFAKIQLGYSGITTSDLDNFYTINPDRTQVDSNNYYTLMTAAKTNYIQFDLHFRVEVSEGGADKNYALRFVNESYSQTTGVNNQVTETLPDSMITRITGAESLIRLSNKLTTQNKTYESGETITINPVNAMRLGVNNITENQTQKILFEPYEGLGSYAIENGEGKYNPSTNAMFTYFNTDSSKYKLKAIAEDQKEFYMGAKTFSEAVTLGTFSPISDNAYNDITLTITIWLEGMDADYLAGISANTISFYLNFCKVEVAA